MARGRLTARAIRERDAYGQEIWNCYQGVTTYEVVERDDGCVDVGSALLYFLAHDKWPVHERKAIRHARGPVLDIGCGAGRVALYLQERGERVLAIDKSPLAVKVAKQRGVKAARALPIEKIRTLRGPFRTIVMYGNNFGLFGGMAKARRMLAIMDRITTPDATIIASTIDPYRTRDPLHLATHRRNLARGRMAGQTRLRIRYRQFRSEWFDYLLASRDEVQRIVEKTCWTIRDIVESGGPGYVVVLGKAPSVSRSR